MKGPPLCPDGDINTRRFRLSTHLHQSVERAQQVERDGGAEAEMTGGHDDYSLFSVPKNVEMRFEVSRRRNQTKKAAEAQDERYNGAYVRHIWFQFLSWG